MSLSVLLVEDDQELARELSDFLSQAGFEVRCAGSVAEAEAALAEPADMLVLDINLPDGSGLDLCRALRQTLRSGIVMCTGRDERELRIASLKDGADAYLVKPVDPEELEATLISVHRRLHALPAPFLQGKPLLFPWRLDAAQRLLTAPNGVGVLLLPGEAIAVDALFSRADHSASREDLIELLGIETGEGSAHRLEVLISRLRRKVRDKTGLKLPLVSQYGRGYEFSAHVQRTR